MESSTIFGGTWSLFSPCWQKIQLILGSTANPLEALAQDLSGACTPTLANLLVRLHPDQDWLQLLRTTLDELIPISR